MSEQFISFRGAKEALAALEARIQAGEIAGMRLTPVKGGYDASYSVLASSPAQPLPAPIAPIVAEPVKVPVIEPQSVPEVIPDHPAEIALGSGIIDRIQQKTAPVITTPCPVCQCPLEPAEICQICAGIARARAAAKERRKDYAVSKPDSGVRMPYAVEK